MCQFFHFFLYFFLKTVTATLIHLHVKEEKTNRFLACLFKYRHQLIDLKASLAYIRSIMGEKLSCNVSFFPLFYILKTVTATLIRLNVKEEKTYRFLACLFKLRHHIIDLKASFTYVRSIM